MADVCVLIWAFDRSNFLPNANSVNACHFDSNSGNVFPSPSMILFLFFSHFAAHNHFLSALFFSVFFFSFWNFFSYFSSILKLVFQFFAFSV